MAAAAIAEVPGGGYRSGEWHRCRCPVHRSDGPTLALRGGARGLIVPRPANCSRVNVLAELFRLRLLDGEGIGTAYTPGPAEIEIERRREADEATRTAGVLLRLASDCLWKIWPDPQTVSSAAACLTGRST